MGRLAFLLLGLAQFTHCAGPMLESIEHAFDPRVAVSSPSVRTIARTGVEEYLTVRGGRAPWEERTVTLGTGESSRVLLSLPEQWSRCWGEGLVVVEHPSAWWYTRCGATNERVTVSITSADRPGAAFFTSDDAAHPRAWITVAGREPAGILLSAVNEHDEYHLRASLVTGGGSTPLGTFERSDSLVLVPQRWQAHRLTGGRIVLVSLESTSTVVVRLFGESGMAETRLPFAPNIEYSEIATACDEHDRLAVAAGRKRGGADLLLVDPEHPAAATPRRLWVDDREQRKLRVVSTPEGFVAAALGPAGAIQLAAFDQRFAYEYAIDANAISGEDEMIDLRPADDGGVDLFWSSRAGIMERQLPPGPLGYLIAADIAARMRALFLRLSPTPAPAAPAPPRS